ncbi:hypothetical protein H072_3210 [Dactylellina haptotyla CBS 200.50]|uniref:Uncharacterized protein n=1 Tax=Dactylellina haptotyla (strain CBS 200.50) TaxID=1284197 RepID=S8AP63_DACHA|nr:hypothetical protein H072_3210 [Dactylellina haptotyla CBS 200.50]
MGCGGSKEDYEASAEPARTAKSTYRTSGPGHTLGGDNSAQGRNGSGATSSVPSNAGNAAAAAAARREEAQRAAEARTKTKLKPQPNTAAPGSGNLTSSDTLAWN